jgi:hypothetical protein
MNRVRVIIAALLGGLAANACETGQKPPGIDYAADSAMGDSTYFAQLQRWQRDSIVLDSVTREVNTATLYALYRRALARDGVTLRLLTDIGCEELRVGMQSGAVPSERAIKAMLDTVYRDIRVTDALGYLARHAPREGMIATGSNCLRLPSLATKAVGDTRLDVEFPRPRPQRRVPTGR